MVGRRGKGILRCSTAMGGQKRGRALTLGVDFWAGFRVLFETPSRHAGELKRGPEVTLGVDFWAGFHALLECSHKS